MENLTFPVIDTDFADTRPQRFGVFECMDTRGWHISPGKAPLDVMLEYYPRIHSRITALWGSQELQDAFTRWLFTDQEGRRGWSVFVSTALLQLSNEHSEAFNLEGKLTFNTWRDTW